MPPKDSSKVVYYNVGTDPDKNYIPVMGEILVNDQGDCRIGNGIDTWDNLPTISNVSCTGTIEDNALTVEEIAAGIIETNIELIEKERFDELYEQIWLDDVGVKLTEMLQQAGIDPLPHLTKIPSYLGPDRDKQYVWATSSPPYNTITINDYSTVSDELVTWFEKWTDFEED